jgi:hypothetical protein
MTYQVRAMIEDAGCDEFRVLCARDLEIEVGMSSVLLVERMRSLYQRVGSLATAPQKRLTRITKAIQIFSWSPLLSTLQLSSV